MIPIAAALKYILMPSFDSKLDRLRETIARLQSCAIAFSGGVDSTLVLKVAHDALGDRVIAVTALSESLPNGELEAAEEETPRSSFSRTVDSRTNPGAGR